MLLFITIDFGNICILLKFVLTKRDAVKYLSDKLLSNDEIYTFPCHLRDVSILFVENNEKRSKKNHLETMRFHTVWKRNITTLFITAAMVIQLLEPQKL